MDMRISKDYVISSPFPDVPVPNEDAWTFLERGLLQNINNTALIDATRHAQVTYKEFHSKVLALARGLRSRSLAFDVTKPVCLFSENRIESCIICTAVWRVGGVVAMVNPLLSKGELRNNFQIVSSEVVFCSDATYSTALSSAANNIIKHIILMDEKPDSKDVIKLSTLYDYNDVTPIPSVRINPWNDTALILFSSGTTGLPKGVRITHRGVVAEALVLGLKQTGMFSGIGIVYQPFSHIYGIMLWYIMLSMGSKCIILGKFDLEYYIKLISEYKCKELYLVPPIAVGFCKSRLAEKYDLSHVRHIFCGAAPLGKSTEEEILQQMKYCPSLEFQQLYALTESSGSGTVCPSKTFFPNERCPSGSIGLPMSRAKIKIIDMKCGRNLPPNQEGEIMIKCDYFMKGYIGNEKATNDMITKDCWMHTGDIGYYDENGYIFVVDRLKELIKYKGYQVSPAELEDMLLTHPDVSDCGVTSLPDEECGELPYAWVVRKHHSTVTAADIQKFVSDNAASYKKLRGGVKFVDVIPKSASGKILRREIKRLSMLRSSKL